MKLYVPDDYAAFQCVGGVCPDSCCIGWEIDVDEEAMTRYAAVSGPFGEKLRSGIVPGEPPHFRLTAEERCPFLNENNLCEIILNLGEDHLCRICDRHPRFIDRWADRVEMGLTLACPAACDQILGRVSPMTLVAGPEEEQRRWADFLAEPDDTDPALLDFVLALREKAFALAAEDRPLAARCADLLRLAALAQDELDFGDGESAWAALTQFETGTDIPASAPAMEALPDLFRSLEALDDSWEKALCGANPAACSLSDAQSSRLLEYFLFRHLLGAARDGDLYGRMGFCLLSLWCVRALSATLSPAEAARLYSKTVEYSDENPDILMEAVNAGEPLEYETLLGLFENA